MSGITLVEEKGNALLGILPKIRQLLTMTFLLRYWLLLFRLNLVPSLPSSLPPLQSNQKPKPPARAKGRLFQGRRYWPSVACRALASPSCRTRRHMAHWCCNLGSCNNWAGAGYHVQLDDNKYKNATLLPTATNISDKAPIPRIKQETFYSYAAGLWAVDLHDHGCCTVQTKE